MSKKKNLLTPRRVLLLVVLVSFILILTFFFGDSGIVEIIRTQNKIEELKKNIETLELEKKQLKDEIEELKSDPMALEKTAREKLWLMKKNEKVVVIIKDSDKKNPPQKSPRQTGK